MQNSNPAQNFSNTFFIAVLCQTHEQMWILHGMAGAKIRLMKKLCINIVIRWEAHGVHPAQTHVWHRSTRSSASDFFSFSMLLCSVPVGKHKNSTHFLKRKGNNFPHVCVYTCTHICMCVYLYLKTRMHISMYIKNTFSMYHMAAIWKSYSKNRRQKKVEKENTDLGNWGTVCKIWLFYYFLLSW